MLIEAFTIKGLIHTMARISIELVPRTPEALAAEINVVKEKFPNIDTVNIPDIIRFKTRSWDACSQAGKDFTNTIPHIRTMDFSLQNPKAYLEILDKHNFKEILLVYGDKPQTMGHTLYPTTSPELIRLTKEERPDIKVYGAIDPYRSCFQDELTFTKRKIDAGADGFFTQPFFDLRLMKVYADLLKGTEVFWGISPVLTQNSKNYWETRNLAVFPDSFEPTMEWNKQFAREAIEFAKETDSNLYFMPIRADIEEYLSGLF